MHIPLNSCFHLFGVKNKIQTSRFYTHSSISPKQNNPLKKHRNIDVQEFKTY